MSWNIRIGRFFGIDVFIHATFLLLLLWVVGQAYYDTRDWREALDQLVFVVLVFTIVVMHEYGHALTARLFGVKTRDIILLPIGGVARLESIPQKPWQELLIAIAGPAVNVVLVIVCLMWLVIEGALAVRQQDMQLPGNDVVKSILESSLAFRLLAVNVSLVFFNMIPAFPMDGGRVLRSLLAMGLDYVRATQIASYIGQAVAVIFLLIGLYARDPMLFLIALFVWSGAAQEYQFVLQRAALSGATVAKAMSTTFFTLYPFDTLEAAAQKLVYGPQLEFPVVHGDQLVGILSRNEISAALAQLGGQRFVSEVMRRDVPTARPEERLLDILPRMQQSGGQSLAVLDGEKLIGLLSVTDVGQLLSARR